MDDALDAFGRRPHGRPRRESGQPRGQSRRRRVEPAGFVCRWRQQNGTNIAASRHATDEAREPVASEARVQQHDPSTSSEKTSAQGRRRSSIGRDRRATPRPRSRHSGKAIQAIHASWTPDNGRQAQRAVAGLRNAGCGDEDMKKRGARHATASPRNERRVQQSAGHSRDPSSRMDARITGRRP